MLSKKNWEYRILSVLLFFLCQCGSPSTQLLVIEGNTMGTTYVVKAVVHRHVDEIALRQGIQEVVDRINTAMSNWVPTSDVSQFQTLPPGKTLAIGTDTQRVAALSLEIAKKTDGAFDPTVSPLIELWGFGTKKRDHFPSKDEIDERLAQVGYQKLILEGATLGKTQEGLELNLGAIAKGYALDEVAKFLDSFGMEHYLIDIGRELRGKGTNPQGDPWRVAIENPDPGGESPFIEVVALTDKSIATSGNYRQYFEHEGVQYSHILDPRTGWPIPPQVALASVIADTCAKADGWATALMVLPPEKGIRLVEAEQDMECLLVIRDQAGVYSIQMSRGFKNHLLDRSN